MLKDPSLPEDKRNALEEKLNALVDDGHNGVELDLCDKKIMFSPHPDYPSLSSSIEIKYEKDRGRFGVAARDIKVGETLVFETATAAKVSKSL